MSKEEENLYKEFFLDYGRNLRNYRVPNEYLSKGMGMNPMCGDELELYLSEGEDRKYAVSFQGNGCVICMASASYLTELADQQTVEWMSAKSEEFLTQAKAREFRKEFSMFQSLNLFSSRVKCASLAWSALQDSVKNICLLERDTVKT